MACEHSRPENKDEERMERERRRRRKRERKKPAPFLPSIGGRGKRKGEAKREKNGRGASKALSQ
jgi:hypothetical protein